MDEVINGTCIFVSTKQLVIRHDIVIWHDYTNHPDYDKFVYRSKQKTA